MCVFLLSLSLHTYYTGIFTNHYATAPQPPHSPTVFSTVSETSVFGASNLRPARFAFGTGRRSLLHHCGAIQIKPVTFGGTWGGWSIGHETKVTMKKNTKIWWYFTCIYYFTREKHEKKSVGGFVSLPEGLTKVSVRFVEATVVVKIFVEDLVSWFCWVFLCWFFCSWWWWELLMVLSQQRIPSQEGFFAVGRIRPSQFHQPRQKEEKFFLLAL